MRSHIMFIMLVPVAFASPALAEPVADIAPPQGVKLVNKSRRPNDTCARFEPSVRELLSSPLLHSHPAPTDQQSLRSGIARALAHGLSYSNDVVGYLILMRVLGTDFEKRNREDAAILGDKKQPGWKRIGKILERLKLQHLEPALDCFTSCGVFRRVRWGEAFDFEENDVALTPDGSLLSGSVDQDSTELTIGNGQGQATITVHTSESARWGKYLVSALSSASLPSTKGGRLVVRKIAPPPRQRLAWRRPISLVLGQLAVGSDGLKLQVKRIYEEGAIRYAILDLKSGSSRDESGEQVLECGTKDHRDDTRDEVWYDYLFTVREITVRPYPHLSRVTLVVNKPTNNLIRASFGQWTTLQRWESALFPDGLTITFLGETHAHRPVPPGGTGKGEISYYIGLKFSVRGKGKDQWLEVKKHFTWRGYHIELKETSDLVRTVTLKLTK